MGIPILMYHAIDERPSHITVSPSTFKGQMEALHQGGFNVVPLSSLVQSLRNNERIPPKTVVLTFDDGFENVYTSAFPVLQECEFSATVFLVAGYIGKDNNWPGQPPSIPIMPLMDWGHIREMEAHGIEFGGHTYSHPALDKSSPQEHNREIVDSKAIIEDKLGHSIDLFAYPYGRYNTASAELVNETYSGACTTYLSLASTKSDPMALERVETLYVQRPQAMRFLSSPLMSIYLDIRRPVRNAASAILKREWE